MLTPHILDIDNLTLKHGSHRSPSDGMCVMEAVAFVAGEEHADHPVCACPVITSFCISLNDSWEDADRQRLKPYIPQIVGTRLGFTVELRRAMCILDWVYRVYLQAWYEAGGLIEQAAALRALPAIVDEATIRPAEALADQAALAALDARDALTARDARAALAALDALGTLGTLTARAALAALDARDDRDDRAARAALAALDALGTLTARAALVVDRAIRKLPPGATYDQKVKAGVQVIKDVAATIRTSELALLDKMIACGSSVGASDENKGGQ